MAMIWETAILNKTYKTQDYHKIKYHAGIGKALYVVSNDTNKGGVAEDLEVDDINLFQFEDDLFLKYGIEDLISIKNSTPFYSQYLYYFDGVLKVTKDMSDIDEQTLEVYQEWIGVVFRSFYGLGPDETDLTSAEFGLEKLNKHLALRSCILNYQISALDVIVISAIRRNNQVWESMVNTNFKGYENIKRWFNWIEGLNEIRWDKIFRGKKGNQSTKQKKNK